MPTPRLAWTVTEGYPAKKDGGSSFLAGTFSGLAAPLPRSVRPRRPWKPSGSPSRPARPKGQWKVYEGAEVTEEEAKAQVTMSEPVIGALRELLEDVSERAERSSREAGTRGPVCYDAAS